MSFNSFGKIFKFTTWGESHGPAIGCVIDGCPPNISISEHEIQKDMNRRKPGQSKFTTQRKEEDKVVILSGVFEGKTTGTPISINASQQFQFATTQVLFNKEVFTIPWVNVGSHDQIGRASCRERV